MFDTDPTSADLDRGARFVVVVGVADNDEPSDALLCTAADLAERRGHTLRIVHVSTTASPNALMPSASFVPAGPGAVQRSESAGMNFWTDAVLRRHPYLDVQSVAVHGDPSRPSRPLASAAQDAAMLVVGHRPRGRAHVDRTVNDLLNEAPCPVLVVPAGTALDHRSTR